MSNIKWFSGGQLGEEETFEEEVKDIPTNDWNPLVNEVYMSLGGFSIPIRMDMKFENLINYNPYNFNKFGFTRGNLSYAPTPRSNSFDKDITFIDKNKERNYELFIDLFFNDKKLSSLVIEQFDRNGFVLRRVTLHGVRLKSRSNITTGNYEVNVVFDYWKDEYI